MNTRIFRGTLPLVALATMAFLAPTARADSYAFSFDGGGMSGSGVLDVSSVAVPGVAGAYQVTGISGTFSDSNLSISNASITGLQTTSLPTNIGPTGLFAPPANQADGTGFSYDNLYYPGGDSPAVCPPPGPGDPNPPYPFGGGYLDIYGVSFNVQGGYNVDLWSNGVVPDVGLTYGVGDSLDGTVLSTFGEPFSNTSITFGTSPVPEPGTLALLGTGLVGLGSAFRRRMRFDA